MCSSDLIQERFPRINRRPRTLEIDPRESLLDVLRERLELTGAENLLGA